MSGRIRTGVRGVLAALPLLLLVACHVVVHRDDGCDDDTCGPPAAAIVPLHEPKLCKDPSMHAMACDLDHLEKHIDWFGSVTAKTPDVWGQARLTRYREEIEEQLAAELKNFKLYLNGQVSRSDQAFLASATTLSLAANPRAAVAPASLAPVSTSETKTEYLTPPLTPKTRTSTEKVYDSAGRVLKETKTDEEMAKADTPPAAPAAPPPPTAKDAGDPTKLVSDPDAVKAVSRTEVQKVERRGIDANFDDTKIGLEPVEYLNQKKRYLEYLAQLRRENEGDDTADSPGYAISLLRIPVSVLPGKRTDASHGAEITFTIDSVLSDELLPATFRGLVTNDLVKQLGFPLTKFLDAEETRALLSDENRVVVRHADALEQIAQAIAEGKPEKEVEDLIAKLPRALREKFDTATEAAEQRVIANAFVAVNNATDNQDKTTAKAALEKLASAKKGEDRVRKLEAARDEVKKVAPEAAPILNTNSLDTARAEARKNTAQSAERVAKLLEPIKWVIVPYSTGTRSRQALPFSQFEEAFGGQFLFEIGYRARQALGGKFKLQGYAHLPDIQSFLKSEIDAAYRLLQNERNVGLWTQFCTDDIVHLVHTRNYDGLRQKREQFRSAFLNLVGNVSSKEDPDEQPEFSSTVALAWMMLVDAALLNDRLMQDMKETAAAKQVVLPCDHWQPFYLPDPPADVRATFAQFVKARWPVHVFALDPETNDQNIADSLSLRREFQVALSIAFAGGQINTNQFNRFVRRLEAEYETVALNRTQIGFSHGANTFGWRFYPRFQTPATRSNLVTIARDQVFGGPNYKQLLRERRLEPGPRECTALVIMPSFVPNVTLDVASNWFGLANPKHKVFDHTQALHLSRTVQAIRSDGCAVRDAHKYRDIDHRLLLARAEQLSNRLPLQTMAAQVPTNDNLSGFELFVNGSSSLAPQLYGWYGAPGVAEGKDTTLFLAGDHFSVTQTRVLAGNQPVTDKQMISRQVMQIRVPAAAIRRGDGTVQVNVATPYGVSQELLVPVIPAKQAVAAAQPTVPTTAAVTYDKQGKGDGTGKYELANPQVAAQATTWLQWPAASAPDLVQVQLRFLYKNCPLTVTLKDPIAPQGNLVPLNAAALKAAAGELLTKLNQYGPFADETNPLTAGLTTESVRLIPLYRGGQPDAEKAPAASVTQLGLTFNCRVPVPAKPPEAVPPVGGK